jgi:CxxC-x17-CxxC domain-containing protein
MIFKEKLLHCYNCNKNFTFSVEEQELRSSRGYPNDPVNCPVCRRARKSNISKHEKSDDDSSSNRQMFSVVCTQCRKALRVPFQPRPGKPIYCIDCLRQIRPVR